MSKVNPKIKLSVDDDHDIDIQTNQITGAVWLNIGVKNVSISFSADVELDYEAAEPEVGVREWLGVKDFELQGLEVVEAYVNLSGRDHDCDHQLSEREWLEAREIIAGFIDEQLEGFEFDCDALRNEYAYGMIG